MTLTIILTVLLFIGVVSATENVTDDIVSVDDETDNVEVNCENMSVNLDNEISVSSESNQNISSDSINSVNSIADSTILGASYDDCLNDGSNYATDVIGGLPGDIISDGDNFIFRHVDRQDVIIKKGINNQYGNSEFQVYKMLPTSFKYGDYIYVLREPSSEISNEWYYDKIYLPSNTEMYLLHLDAPYDANGAIGGFAGDKMGVYAKVTDSKGNPADGYVVFDDLATRSSPILLTNGRASYEYTLKYTGPNGGFVYAYYYKGGYSEANLMAKNSIKYVGLRTTYVFEFDQDVYYYSDENKLVTFNISVYNKDKPWKEVSGKIQAAFSQDDWVSDGITPRDIVWNPILQKGTASFTLFVEGRKFVRFRLMPGNTIRCDDYYIPVKYLNTPVIDASINRVGSQINVNMTFEDRRHQAIGFGEATLNIPSINKIFRFNVTNKTIQFSFTQEDYFSNENTIFYINYHDDLGFFEDGQKEIIFKDTIYTGTSMSITNLNFIQGSDLTPKVTIATTDSFEKQGFVKLTIDGKTYVEQVNNGICQFNIDDYYDIGSHNAIFEYYYDNSHLASSKNVTITISVTATDEFDFVIANQWFFGDTLKPKIQVVKNGAIISKGYVNNRKISDGYATLDLGSTNGPVEKKLEFSYDSSSNPAFSKTIRFKQDKRPVELESVNHIDVAVGENITFDVSIKNYAELLDLIPLMKRSDSYYKPWVDARTHREDIKMIKADYDNGVYTFVYSPTRNAETISFHINSLYIKSELVIPVNLKKLDPVMELENNGTITLLNNKLGIKFANKSTTEGSFTITADGFSKFKWVSYVNNFTYYEIPFNTIGEKNINIVYKPTIYAPYNGFEKNITINIVKETPIFTFQSNGGKFDQTVPITIKIGNISGILPTGKAILTFNNKDSEIIINKNVIQSNIQLPNKPGSYLAKFNYTGDDIFDSVIVIFNISVIKQDLTLISNNSIKVKSNENIVLSLSALSEFNKNANIDSVNIKLGNNIIPCSVVNNMINFTMPQNIDFNNMIISFGGDDFYNPTSKTIKIIKVIDSIEIPQIITNNELLSFNLPIDAKGTVTIEIANKTYTSTISNGNVKFDLSKVDAGNQSYIISYAGDSNYYSLTKYGSITIKAIIDDVVVPHELNPSVDKSLKFVFPENAEGTIILTINNVNYTSNVYNGFANVNISDLSDGDYSYIMTYTGDDKYSSFTRTGSLTINNIVPTTLSSSFVTTAYNGGKYLVATLKDINNKPIVGVQITINLNGVKYLTTDKNGQVKLSTNGLAPNTYTTTITFAGNTNYAKSTTTAKVTVKKATPKLTANKKTFKKSVKTKKYTVTLKDNVGKAIKNTKVTIKVNKKTYTAKTNSKGVATFKITKLTKKGKYTATVTYKGSSYYNKLTKKVKITIK